MHLTEAALSLAGDYNVFYLRRPNINKPTFPLSGSGLKPAALLFFLLCFSTFCLSESIETQRKSENRIHVSRNAPNTNINGVLPNLPLDTSQLPLSTTLPQLESMLSSHLIGLTGFALNNINTIKDGESPLSLLHNKNSNCAIRLSAPLNFNFGSLMPAEPSSNSIVSFHFSVDCKRPAAYRVVVVDEKKQQLYGPFLPASILQGDGSRTPATVLLLLNGQPLGSELRNNGVNLSQLELSAELRASPEIPLTPYRAGSVKLGLESASLVLIEFGLLN